MDVAEDHHHRRLAARPASRSAIAANSRTRSAPVPERSHPRPPRCAGAREVVEHAAAEAEESGPGRPRRRPSRASAHRPRPPWRPADRPGPSARRHRSGDGPAAPSQRVFPTPASPARSTARNSPPWSRSNSPSRTSSSRSRPTSPDARVSGGGAGPIPPVAPGPPPRRHPISTVGSGSARPLSLRTRPGGPRTRPGTRRGGEEFAGQDLVALGGVAEAAGDDHARSMEVAFVFDRLAGVKADPEVKLAARILVVVLLLDPCCT